MILYQMLKRTANKYPKKTAIIYNKIATTYQEYLRQVDHLQQCLKMFGIYNDMRVGLIFHNSDMYCFTLYALSKNNNISCLMNPLWNEDEIERKLRIARLEVAIVEDYVWKVIKQKKSELCNEIRFITRTQLQEMMRNILAQEVDECCEVSEKDLWRKELIQSSSGTTGCSKMAYRSQRNLLYDARNIVSTLQYDSSDIVYCPVSICHGYGLTMGIIAPVMCGATIVIERLFRCKHFLNHYDKIRPTIFLGIPENYEEMCTYLEGKKMDFSYRKWFFCSGAPIKRETGEAFFEITNFWINQVLGMMEVSTICANLSPTRDNFLSVGTPVLNVNVKLDRCKKNTYLSLFVKSETVSKEYIVDGKDVPIEFYNGWFHTKDIGDINEEGEIFVKGREGEEK